MASLFAVLAFGLVFYLNFRYGYSDPSPIPRDQREVRERDYFFICSFSLWGVWAGIGIAALWQAFTERFALDGRRRPSLLAAPVLAFALIPFAFNFSWATRHYDYSARDWAYNMLNSVEPYGVLFTNGDNDTFPLWYAQEVEGIRRDVTVIVMSYLNTPWYARQLRDLTAPCEPGESAADDRSRIICQRVYDVASGPALYNERMTTGDLPAGAPAPEPGRRPPTRSILPLTDDEIQRIAATPPSRLGETMVFTAANLETVLSPETVIVPATTFLATILNGALDDRPIYFAMTTQAYEDLNLGAYLIRHGVALKLSNGPVEQDLERGIIRLEGEMAFMLGRFVDVPRTEALTAEIFMHRGGFPDRWTRWVDPATDQIPAYYGYSHYGMEAIYRSLGNEERANFHRERGDAFWRLYNLRYAPG